MSFFRDLLKEMEELDKLAVGPGDEFKEGDEYVGVASEDCKRLYTLRGQYGERCRILMFEHSHREVDLKFGDDAARKVAESAKDSKIALALMMEQMDVMTNLLWVAFKTEWPELAAPGVTVALRKGWQVVKGAHEDEEDVDTDSLPLHILAGGKFRRVPWPKN